MSFFNRYPYQDEHELNLDWLLAKMKKLNIEFDEFKVINQITFSGEWDITKQYPAWTIVSDNNIGYVSIKPVPAGVLLTNGNYWRAVIDYTAQIAGLQTRVVNLENTVGDSSSGLVKDVSNLQAIVGDSSNGLVKDVADLQNDISDLSKCWLENKNIYVFGDSLAEPKTGGIFEHLKAKVPSCTIHNYAIPGTDMSQIASEIPLHDITDADVVYILGGTNNWQGGSSLNDFYTYVVAVVSAVFTQKATVKLVFITPPYSWSSNFSGSIVPYLKNNAYCGITDYANIVKFVCNQNNIPVIDLYNYSNIGPNNYTVMMEDSGSGGSTIYVHPLSHANEFIADLIINQVYNNKYDVFTGILANYWDATGITVTAGNEVVYDPNSGALDLSAEVWLGASVTAPSGYHLQCNLPYGSWIMFSNQYRHDEYRFPVLDYMSMSMMCVKLTFNATQYMGAILIEGTLPTNHTLVISH